MTKDVPNQNTFRSKGIVGVGGTCADRKVTLTLRWDVKKKDLKTKKMVFNKARLEGLKNFFEMIEKM